MWLVLGISAWVFALVNGAGLLGATWKAAAWTLIWGLPVAVLVAAGRSMDLGFGPLVLVGVVALYTLLFFRTPAVFQRKPVVDLEPGELADALQGLAEAQGVQALSLKRIQTGASLGAHAFAANLSRPAVAVAHGLTQRLEPAEQLAIGAHEIAHIRSGSLWWLMGGFPLVLALGFSSLFFVSVSTATGLALCLGIFLPRLWLSRATELLCDRMAAEWTSPEALREGLRRLHAVHPVDLASFWGRAAYSLATHPPLPVRLAALGDTQTDAQAHRRAAALGQAGLLVLVSVALALDLGFWPFIVLALTPTLLLSLGAKAAIQRQRKRMPGRRPWFVLGVVLLVPGVVWAVQAQQAGESLLWPVLFLLVLELILVPLAWRHHRRGKSVKALTASLAKRDFESIWEMRTTQARQLYRDPALSHDVLAVGVLLDQYGAAKELQELIPRFPQAGLTLADLLVYRDPQASLAAAEAFAEWLPEDPGGPVGMGRALLAQGDLEGAQAQLARAHALDGRAAAMILEADLALARANYALCHTQLEAVESVAPGDPWMVLVRADLAVNLGEWGKAQADLDHVAETLAAMPVQGMSVRLEQLRERLSASLATQDAHSEE